MSLSVVKAHGVVAYTLTTPETDGSVPLVCHLFKILCCSSFCKVTHKLKNLFNGNQGALGTVQIMIGLVAFSFGTVLSQTSYTERTQYWIGVTCIVSGILCVIADKFPSPCLVLLTILMNTASAIIAGTAVVFLAIDLPWAAWWHACSEEKGYHSSKTYIEECLKNKQILSMISTSLKSSLLIFGVLQLCISIAMAVLGSKTLCKYKGTQQLLPEHEQLLGVTNEDCHVQTVPNPT
ncbi:membrane-spanning 4-domains subfamily A member 5-like [Polyodon spathula]|uniref:membrane-spanning 4-domains subfamily A member 5-like n=1 Tax=Polyodon spathula TaxID=7913 RepID=UPI001B7E32EC|nr:membrane-spanning 4-domains subfamily A member 5-like [Polyodon spathula]